MLSILIPVYNTNVTILVDRLREQGLKLDVPFEIVVLDDASDHFFFSKNSIIADWNEVRLIRERKKLGRSGSRNKLATLAIYNYLLFIDGDAAVPDEDFLSTYYRYCRGNVIICGGTSYHADPPESQDLFFRWKYGVKRESVPAVKRNKNPNAGFSSFNFLIVKKIFLAVRFNEELHGYGHEDTLFGYELQQKGFRVTHIDNPLLHEGLEPHDEFKRKSVEGLKNLQRLIIQMPEAKDFIRQVRLLRMYHRLKKFRILPLPEFLGRKLLRLTNKKTNLPDPNLFMFDIYKLLYYSSLNKP